jgi:hypothetical protein
MADPLRTIATNILADPAPILLPDTCALLDIIRHPVRPHYDHRISRDAAVLVTRAQARQPRQLWIAAAFPTDIEWSRLHQSTTESTDKRINEIEREIQQISNTSIHLGGQALQIPQMVGLTLPARLHAIASSIYQEAHIIEVDPTASAKATVRRLRGSPPVKKGTRDDRGANDCEIFEHYLALARLLRQESFQLPIIMVTSNTDDFGDPKSRANPVVQECTAAGLIYVTDFVWALHCLEGGNPPP